MHVSNFTKSDAFKVIAEIERHARTYRNNVDLSRSSHNLYDAYGQRSITDNYRKVLEGVYIYGEHSKHAKTTALSSIVITLPQAIPPSDMLHFFGKCVEFLDSRYRVDELGRYVGYAIHLDETTPHLHYLLSPIVNDDKHGKKVSSREVFTRTDLQSLHGDLSDFMQRQYGYDVGILCNDEQVRNLPLHAYKAMQELKNEHADTLKLGGDLLMENHRLRRQNADLRAKLEAKNNAPQLDDFLL